MYKSGLRYVLLDPSTVFPNARKDYRESGIEETDVNWSVDQTTTLLIYIKESNYVTSVQSVRTTQKSVTDQKNTRAIYRKIRFTAECKIN